MQAIHEIARRLVLLCLVVLPLQPLQGVHLLCCHASGSSCPEATCCPTFGEPAATTCCDEACCTCHLAGQLHGPTASDAHPCDCPPNCHCNRPAEPQSPFFGENSSALTADPFGEVGLSHLGKAAGKMNPACWLVQGLGTPPECAELCRFLI